jgi:hypothetical protein
MPDPATRANALDHVVVVLSTTTTGARSSFFGHDIDVGLDAPSPMLGGEAFLARVFNAYRSATSAPGANVWNTTLPIGWDEPGGTYDHVPPARSRRPIRPLRRVSSGSRSTDPATGFPSSPCRPGSSRARCTTRSTGTPR